MWLYADRARDIGPGDTEAHRAGRVGVRVGPDVRLGQPAAPQPVAAHQQRACRGRKDYGRQHDYQCPRCSRYAGAYLERPGLVRSRCVIGVSGLRGGDRASAGLTVVTTEPDTEHTPGVSERNETGRPDDADADSLSGRPTATSAGRRNVIACGRSRPRTRSTWNDCVWSGAGAVVGVSGLCGGDRASAGLDGRDHRT